MGSNKNINEVDLENCTFVKTMCMLLVIIGHSMAFWTGTWFTQNPVYQSNGLNTITSFIGNSHIGCFTLVSGYIFRYVKQERGGYNTFRSFIRNKTRRLIVPYCFAMIIWVCPITSFLLDYSVRDIIIKFIFGTAPGQLWFFLMIWFVFIIVYPLEPFISKNYYLGLFLSIVSVVIRYVGNMMLPNIFQVWTAFQYIPIFLIGYYIRKEQGIIRNKSCIIWIMLYTLFSLLQALANMFDWKNSKSFSSLS